MGYYTYYELDIRDEDNTQITDIQLEKLADRFNEITGYTSQQFEDMISFGQNLKWYNAIETLKQLSEEFPNFKFTLEAHGEDPEDIWILYVYKGLTQLCEAKITFDERTLW